MNQLSDGRRASAVLATTLMLALATTSSTGAAGGSSTVTVPGTAASIDNPFAVSGTPSIASGLSFAGVTAITVAADGAETPFAGYQNYSNGGAFVAEFVASGGAPIVLPAGYPADRVCDTYPAYPCTLFWPVGHTGPTGPSSSGTTGVHTSVPLPVPAGAVDVKYAALDSDYGDNGGSYAVTTTDAASPHALLTGLIAGSKGVGPGRSLEAKATAALAAVDAGNTNAACGILGAFDREVAAQTGKSLTTAQSTAFKSATAQIAARLGC